MRDLIVTENITLDGVIDAEGGWFTAGGGGDDIAASNREHMAATDAVLLGRVTYEQFAGYWPKQTDDTTGVSDYLNRTMKYVVSSSLTDPDWQHTTVLHGPLADDIAALKRQARRGHRRHRQHHPRPVARASGVDRRRAPFRLPGRHRTRAASVPRRVR